MLSKKKIFEILKKINVNDKLAVSKIETISSILKDQETGHILPKNLVPWAKKSGLHAELNCEDQTSWWTVNNMNPEKDED